MYYELYIDVLFLINFMMNFLLLMITRRILKCSAKHWQVALGACIGSGLTCLVIVLPIPYPIVKIILFHAVINVMMIWVGLRVNSWRSFAKALVMLYVSGFLLGGVFTYLYQYVRIGSLFFALAVISYFVVQGIWSFIIYIQRIGEYKCQVTLYLNDTKHTISAIIDTGNSLRDPASGRPVCIISKKEMSMAFAQEKINNVRYVPYHSVGKQEGVLPAIEVDKMCVHRKEEHWIDKPIIGICDEEISSGGDYAMILNPEIF